VLGGGRLAEEVHSPREQLLLSAVGQRKPRLVSSRLDGAAGRCPGLTLIALTARVGRATIPSRPHRKEVPHASAALLAAVLACSTVLAAPAPFPKPTKPAPDGPFEIDFTPLDNVPAGHREWSLTVEVGAKTKAKQS
jgi:hypothetical protein